MAEEKNLPDTVLYWPEPTEKESLPAKAGRQAYRIARNAIITGAGATSDIAEGALNLVNAGIEMLPGVEHSPLPHRLPLPTSESIEKNVVEPLERKFLPAGYAESKNEPEEILDTFTRDFVGFLSGGRVVKALGKGAQALGAGVKAVKGGATLAKGAEGLSDLAKSIPFANTFMKVAKFLNPGKTSIGKAATIAGLGNLAKYGSKYLGAGPGTQEGLKVGTMMLASLRGVNGLGNDIKESYKYLNGIVPTGEDAVLSTRNLQTKLTNILEESRKGLPESVVPAKTFVRKTIKGIEKKINPIDLNDAMKPLQGMKGFEIHPAFQNAVKASKSSATVDELWTMKKDLNHIIYESNRHTDATKIHYAEQVRDALNETIKGPQAIAKFPEFTKTLIETDNMMHGFKDVSEISKFLIGHNTLKDISNPMTKLVFYTNLGGGVLNTAGKIATAVTLKNIVAPMEMFMKSPEIRGYYYKAMKAAVAKNAPVANRYIKKFDEAANKINPGDQEGPDTVLSV